MCTIMVIRRADWEPARALAINPRRAGHGQLTGRHLRQSRGPSHFPPWATSTPLARSCPHTRTVLLQGDLHSGEGHSVTGRQPGSVDPADCLRVCNCTAWWFGGLIQLYTATKAVVGNNNNRQTAGRRVGIAWHCVEWAYLVAAMAAPTVSGSCMGQVRRWDTDLDTGAC